MWLSDLGESSARSDPEGRCDEEYSEDRKGDQQGNAFAIEPEV